MLQKRIPLWPPERAPHQRHYCPSSDEYNYNGVDNHHTLTCVTSQAVVVVHAIWSKRRSSFTSELKNCSGRKRNSASGILADSGHQQEQKTFWRGKVYFDVICQLREVGMLDTEYDCHPFRPRQQWGRRSMIILDSRVLRSSPLMYINFSDDWEFHEPFFQQLTKEHSHKPLFTQKKPLVPTPYPRLLEPYCFQSTYQQRSLPYIVQFSHLPLRTGTQHIRSSIFVSTLQGWPDNNNVPFDYFNEKFRCQWRQERVVLFVKRRQEEERICKYGFRKAVLSSGLRWFEALRSTFCEKWRGSSV